jgi:hypothetical protein
MGLIMAALLRRESYITWEIVICSRVRAFSAMLTI